MYTTLPFPYDYWSRQMTPGTAKKALTQVLEELPERMNLISNYIEQNVGVKITAESGDEALNLLPGAIASLGRLVSVPTDEIEERLAKLRPEDRSAYRITIGKKRLDNETQEMVFDGALLWGEAFRKRYSQCEWSICRSPLSAIEYGQPMLTRPGLRFARFGPVWELHGEVGILLNGRPTRDWPLVKIMKMRAHEFELDDDPRL
jgi:hypothetical protein